MNTVSASPLIIRFQCSACAVELTVPSQLAGIEGPCPACHRMICAPMEAPARNQSRKSAGSPPAGVIPIAPVVPMPTPWAGTQSTALRPPARKPAAAEPAVVARGFQARLTIPPPEEPLDDSWRVRHRAQSRSQRRVQRIERTAEKVVNSSVFRVGMSTMIVLTGGLTVWLYYYMRDRHWQLPWQNKPVATRSAPAASTPPNADSPEEELPLAADRIASPAGEASKPGQPPLAGTNR